MTDITEITRRALENRRVEPPSDKIITLLAKQKLMRQVMGEMSPLTYADKISQQWLDDATSTDPSVRLPSRRDLMERLEGKVPQAMTGADGGDLVIQIVKYSANDFTESVEAPRLSGPGMVSVAGRN